MLAHRPVPHQPQGQEPGREHSPTAARYASGLGARLALRQAEESATKEGPDTRSKPDAGPKEGGD